MKGGIQKIVLITDSTLPVQRMPPFRVTGGTICGYTYTTNARMVYSSLGSLSKEDYIEEECQQFLFCLATRKLFCINAFVILVHRSVLWLRDIMLRLLLNYFVNKLWMKAISKTTTSSGAISAQGSYLR